MRIMIRINSIMQSKQWKKTAIIASIVLAYLSLVLPYILTIPFSIPSADDFSMGANLSYSSLFLSALERANYCYLNFGGGIWIAKFLEVLLSPIVSHEIDSMAYGATMLIFFFLFLISFNIFLRNLFTYEFPIENRLYREIMVLLSTAVPLLGACYPEVFYWFTGAPYAWFMALSFLTCSYMMKYFHLGGKRYFFLFCFFGVISSTDIPYAVPVILFYIAMLYRYRRKDLHVRTFLPVVLCIIGALTYLLSPGAQARREAIGGSEIGIVSLVNAGVMTIVGALSRLHVLLAECPLSMVLLFPVLLLGIWNKGTKKRTFGSVCWIFIISFLATMGALYPVMLGYGVCAMPNRICFVFDYLFFLTVILTVFSLGQFLAWTYDFAWDKSKWIMVLAFYLLTIYSSLIAGRWYPESCWAKSLFSLSAVQEEHDEWIDIFCEIESTDEKDVVIKHDRIKATGILCDPQIGEDEEYWVNAAAARFFKKESIRIEWQEPVEE